MLFHSIIAMVTTEASITAIAPCDSKHYSWPVHCYYHCFSQYNFVWSTYSGDGGKKRAAVIRTVLLIRKVITWICIIMSIMYSDSLAWSFFKF